MDVTRFKLLTTRKKDALIPIDVSDTLSKVSDTLLQSSGCPRKGRICWCLVEENRRGKGQDGKQRLSYENKLGK